MTSHAHSLFRCDWQIDLDCFEPLDASTANLNTGLESFAAAVIFDPHLTSAQREFGSQPVKKIFFPPQPTVSRCVEKSALQFRIKGTGYILELIRFDKYKPGSSTQRQLGAGHAATWGATLFDPRWVSVLGGESSPNALRFERPAGRFEAFFPWSSGGNEGGFWEFMEVVNKVADLLKCPHNSNRQGRGVEGVSDLLRADFGTLY